MTTLETSLSRVADEFEDQLDDLVVEHVARQREFDEFAAFDAPEVWESVKRITRDSRRLQAIHLRTGMSLPESCPGPDVEAAHLAAHGGASLTTVIRSYGVGHLLAAEAWLDSVDRLDLDDASRRGCIRAITRFVNEYDDRIIRLVTEEYQREAERAQRSPDQIRLRLLRNLIEGLSDSADGIDYELDAEHVGIVAWGQSAKTGLRELATVLDRRLLWAPVGDLVWAWLGGREPLDFELWSSLRGFPMPGGSRLAAGNPGQGLEGFRRSHRQAGEAHVVGIRSHDRITLYGDVTLEAFALRDETAARDFVESVLGRFDAEAGMDQARATLRAYFTASQNAAAAAAALGVHGQTVARRLHSIEQRLGTSVNERRAELELALRLDDLLTS